MDDFKAYDNEMKSLFDEIKRLTKLSNTDRWKRVCKLIEEVGEYAECQNSAAGEIGCRYKHLNDSNALEEISDILIVTLSLLSTYDGVDLNDIYNLMRIKLIKWNDNVMEESVIKNIQDKKQK